MMYNKFWKPLLFRIFTNGAGRGKGPNRPRRLILNRSDFKMPLVNTREMFKRAYEEGYAIGAFNVNNMEIVQGITEACKEPVSYTHLDVYKRQGLLFPAYRERPHRPGFRL